MKYVCVDPVEYLYPDSVNYKSGTDRIKILAPRGSYACAQIMFREGSGSFQLKCEGWNPEVYEMIAVPIEDSLNAKEKNVRQHTPERLAPYEVYDCLKPAGNEVVFRDGVCAVYFSQKIPKDAQVGIFYGSVLAGDVEIPVELEISAAVVPEETLNVIMWYSVKNISTYHSAEPGSGIFDQVETAYLSMMRRMHQNILGCPEPKVTDLGDDRYTFDFSAIKKHIEKSIALGYKKFQMFLGKHVDMEASTILIHGIPSMSYEGYCYLAQYLQALSSFLENNGWTNIILMSICDEPNAANATEYRALCGLVRRFLPNIRLIDATFYDGLHGAMDIYVPRSDEYAANREKYETYRSNGDEIWYYDCNHPRGNGYINRYMDYPLLSTRYHGWGNYYYHLTGYLHWAVNYYCEGQDPFKSSCGNVGWYDRRVLLPAGDTHIVYPGEGAPWMSMRLEHYRAGAEDYEMLRTVAANDKALADTICTTVFRAFDDVTYDPLVFRQTRNRLIRAMEEAGS